MDTELFKMFEEELFDEAKRIVPLVYNKAMSQQTVDK